MQSRTILVLVLAVLCAGSAAFGVNQVLRQMEDKSKIETTSVVVAVRDVPRGGILAEETLAVREWPAKLVPAGVMTDIETVKGRTAAVPIVRDEPILSGKIVDGMSQASLAGLIPPGMRAFTISMPHNASGVGGFIVPGNHVDVLLTTTSSGMARNDNTGGAITTTLLQNIQILAVDQYLDAPDDKKVNHLDVKSVTLLVDPDQSAKLSLAANKGTLHLALRHPDDNSDSGARPTTLNELRLYQAPAEPSRGLMIAERVATGLMAALAHATTSRPQTPAVAEVESSGELSSKTEKAPEKAAPPRIRQIQTLRGTSVGLVQVRLAEQKGTRSE